MTAVSFCPFLGPRPAAAAAEVRLGALRQRRRNEDVIFELSCDEAPVGAWRPVDSRVCTREICLLVVVACVLAMLVMHPQKLTTESLAKNILKNVIIKFKKDCKD